MYCRLLTFLFSPVACFCVLPDLSCEVISVFLCLTSVLHILEIKELFDVKLLIHMSQVINRILIVRRYVFLVTYAFFNNDRVVVQTGTSVLVPGHGQNGATKRSEDYKLVVSGGITLVNYYHSSYSYISRFIDHNVIQLENSMYAYQNFGRTMWYARLIEYHNSNIKHGQSVRRHLINDANYHNIPLTESRQRLTPQQFAVVSASRRL